MGQAKKRGTREERVKLAEAKAKAEAAWREEQRAKAMVEQRKPSAKHTRLLAQMVALGLAR